MMHVACRVTYLRNRIRVVTENFFAVAHRFAMVVHVLDAHVNDFAEMYAARLNLCGSGGIFWCVEACSRTARSSEVHFRFDKV
jgi:hypothetical protein